MIIAPHPDDETFGCGGLIKLKCDAGVSVRIVLLTDGEAVGSAPGESRETVVEARRREFVEACHKLGVQTDDLRFLHLPDGALPQRGMPGFGSAMCALLAEIEDFAPAEVYCTHENDIRPDHVAAAHVAQAALKAWGGPCRLFFYPVWMWYHASSGLRKRLDCHGAWRLDIKRVLSAKKQAMEAYLDAPQRTSAGHPFCGRLPLSFLSNFRRRYEVYFPASGL
jgi:LmbE family N-acetylglucosaminyl deacetylase